MFWWQQPPEDVWGGKQYPLCQWWFKQMWTSGYCCYLPCHLTIAASHRGRTLRYLLRRDNQYLCRDLQIVLSAPEAMRLCSTHTQSLKSVHLFMYWCGRMSLWEACFQWEERELWRKTDEGDRKTEKNEQVKEEQCCWTGDSWQSVQGLYQNMCILEYSTYEA